MRLEWSLPSVSGCVGMWRSIWLLERLQSKCVTASNRGHDGARYNFSHSHLLQSISLSLELCAVTLLLCPLSAVLHFVSAALPLVSAALTFVSAALFQLTLIAANGSHAHLSKDMLPCSHAVMSVVSHQAQLHIQVHSVECDKMHEER